MVESTHNVTCDCKFPVVLSPKYRGKVLANGVDTPQKELLHTKARELQPPSWQWTSCRITSHS
jgi:REP element-mobilizing transposase RayT